MLGLHCTQGKCGSVAGIFLDIRPYLTDLTIQRVDLYDFNIV